MSSLNQHNVDDDIELNAVIFQFSRRHQMILVREQLTLNSILLHTSFDNFAFKVAINV